MSRFGRCLIGLFSLSLCAGIATAQIGSVARAYRTAELDASLHEDDYFGEALANLGDLDGDGIPELAVGAPHVPEPLEANTEAGSVWILFLRADGSVRAT